MNYLSEKYQVKGDSIPDGTKACECIICKGKFAVPTSEAPQFDPPVCEGCKDTYEKAQRDLAAAQAKPADPVAAANSLDSPADKATQL